MNILNIIFWLILIKYSYPYLSGHYNYIVVKFDESLFLSENRFSSAHPLKIYVCAKFIWIIYMEDYIHSIGI